MASIWMALKRAAVEKLEWTDDTGLSTRKVADDWRTLRRLANEVFEREFSDRELFDEIRDLMMHGEELNTFLDTPIEQVKAFLQSPPSTKPSSQKPSVHSKKSPATRKRTRDPEWEKILAAWNPGGFISKKECAQALKLKPWKGREPHSRVKAVIDADRKQRSRASASDIR